MIIYVSNGRRAAVPFLCINLHFFLRPCLWNMKCVNGPSPHNTGGPQTSVKATRRCSPVSPAAQRDEKTADPSLTTSPGWDTFQPPELNQAPVEEAFGYFISSPSPYSLQLHLIYLSMLHTWTQIAFKSHFEFSLFRVAFQLVLCK